MFHTEASFLKLGEPGMRATHNKPTSPCVRPYVRPIQYEICQRRRTGRVQCGRGRPSRQAPLAGGERATNSKCCRIIGVRLPQFERHALPKSAVRISCLRARRCYQVFCHSTWRASYNLRFCSLDLLSFRGRRTPIMRQDRGHHRQAQATSLRESSTKPVAPKLGRSPRAGLGLIAHASRKPFVIW